MPDPERERAVVAASFRSADPAVRAAGVDAVEHAGDATLYALVVRALQDPDPRVRTAAVAALERIGKTNLVKCCRKMLRNKDAVLRDAAAFCLAGTKLPEAVPVLAAALADAHEPVRAKARAGLEAMAAGEVPGAREALAASAPRAETSPTAEDEGEFPSAVASTIREYVNDAGPAAPPPRLAPLSRPEPRAPRRQDGAPWALLLAPALVVAAIACWVAIGALRRPAPVAARPAAAPGGSLDSVDAAADVSAYAGKLVSWVGTVSEVSPERDRVLLKNGAHWFAGRAEGRLPESVQAGAVVRIGGAVVDRRGGVVVVLVRDVAAEAR